MQQAPHLGPTNIRRHRTKFRRPELNWFKLVWISHTIIFGHATTTDSQFCWTISLHNNRILYGYNHQHSTVAQERFSAGATCEVCWMRLELRVLYLWAGINVRPWLEYTSCFWSGKYRSLNRISGKPSSDTEAVGDSSYRGYSAVSCWQNSLLLLRWQASMKLNREQTTHMTKWCVCAEDNQRPPFLCCFKRWVVWSMGSQIFQKYSWNSPPPKKKSRRQENDMK